MPDIREVPRAWHPRDMGEQKRAPGLAPGDRRGAYLAPRNRTPRSRHTPIFETLSLAGLEAGRSETSVRVTLQF